MKKHYRVAGLLASATLLLAACGDAPESRDTSSASITDYPQLIEERDGHDPDAHINAAFTTQPASWDPTESITNGDFSMYAQVYDRLLATDQEGTVIPMLAESFEPSEDNLSMTLTLREGLQFSDGTAFDAEAVKFNLERNAAPESRIAGELNMITSVEVVDPLTVKVNVDTGIGTLAVSLTSRGGVMVSPTAAAAGTLTEMPTGIGPYTATSISPGASVELERTEGYWDSEAQKAASMTMRVILDDQARYNALVSGDIDVALINANQMTAAQSAGLNPVINESALFNYLGVNANIAPFDNPEVRRALNMAIDREAISGGLYDGHCTPSAQYVPTNSPGYSDKLGDGSDEFGYNPEEAKKILEEHGATGVSIEAVPPNVTIYVQLAEAVQAQLADVGITMAVNAVPATELVQRFSIDKTSEAVVSVATVINDPGAVHGRYLTPDALFNPGDADYVELNAAAEAAALPLDPDERKGLYEEYWDIWVETPPHIIPICMIHLGAAANDSISGVYQRPVGYTDLRYAAKHS